MVNNIAWFARRFSAVLIPGDGRYRVQPMHVEDFAALAERAAAAREPRAGCGRSEIYSFDQLVTASRAR